MADFGSESVAAFRRNGWPTCVGISGRLGSEYAAGKGGGIYGVVTLRIVGLIGGPGGLSAPALSLGMLIRKWST